MPRRTRNLTCWRVLLLASWVEVVRCANCYYPNGALSPSNNDQACSTADGAACCPDKWQCMDNGLCYYPSDNLYGRYGCTDQSWQSPHCASNLCTYNMTAAGDEAITQCSGHNNDWCCDGDRQHVNCCTDNSRPFFSLPDGKAYATIGGGSTPSNAPTLNTISGFAMADETGNAKSSAPPSSAAASSNEPSSVQAASASGSGSQQSSGGSQTTGTPSATPVTSLQTSLSSGSGGVQTVVITRITSSTPTAGASNQDSQKNSSHSKLGVIIGCAVGIPVALALLGILFFLFRRHQKKKDPKNPYAPSDTDPALDGAAAAGKLHKQSTYKSENNVPELASTPAGPGRPISTLKGRAELPADGTYQPGHTPQSSWGSAPPGYSPGMNQNQWGPNRFAENAGTAPGVAAAAGENVTAGGRYVPYRPAHPPQMEQVSELPAADEAAELPTVRTPP